MLKIYNSLTREKQPFQPIEKNHIRMYVCGVTVYDHCHLGHARTYIAFDVVTRYLRSQGYKVTYVRNITDIDDKIIKRANETQQNITELTEKYIKIMHEDFAALNCLAPDEEPRATQHMATIIAMIEKLIANGHAYIAANGDVYFKVTAFNNYGQLAHKDLDGLRVGARIEVNEAKTDPLDFVLWKQAKPDEPSWDSPWGKGRPGWHIECSAMATKSLGAHFDIHGGGFDLQFPHHENEIAQAEGANQSKFANTWMHVGFLQIDKEKMSKSLGNFFTISEVLAKYPAEIIRYFMITSHYRTPVNYSQESLTLAKNNLEKFYQALRDVPNTQPPEANDEFIQRFNAAMDDDFNTPEALAVMFECVHEINRQKTSDMTKAKSLVASLQQMGDILGILQLSPEAFLQGEVSATDQQQIENLIKQREQARVDKNWQLADKLRDELNRLGISIEDSSSGTKWRRN